MKYRKKPVVIEATQWFKKGDHPMVFANDDGTHEIWTLEGNMRVTSGDWIITGVNGEHYPCKPDIFEMTYERVVVSWIYAHELPPNFLQSLCLNRNALFVLDLCGR